LTRIALRPALVPLPRLPDAESSVLLRDYDGAGIFGSHCVASVDADAALSELLRLNLGVTTMGRSIEQERAFFLASAAAGILAAQTAIQKASRN